MIKDQPYWWDAAEPEDTNNDPLPSEADVVIVGGGFTGMGAAIPLARAGLSVVVVERDRPGDGASSRNGGITSGNIRWSFSSLVSKFGLEQAKAFYSEGVEAREDLRQFVATEKLDCNYQLTGRFTGAMTAETLDGMKRDADMVQRHVGIEPQIIERANQHQEIGSDLYHGGIARTDIGGVHPAKMHKELKRVAIGSGAQVFGGCGVNAINRIGGRFNIETVKGRINAGHVVVATNGYTDKGLPWLRRRVVPVVSEMIATEPLSPNLMQSLMPKRQMHGESRHLGYYFRPSPDGSRILLGGRRFNNDPVVARERLRQGLVEIFPELSDTSLTHHWFGFVAFPMDQLPKLAIHDGVVYAAGFCGSGVVWARWLGQKAAMIVLGKESGASAFDKPSFKAIPFYNGSPWFLPIMMKWYQFKDRMNAPSQERPRQD